MRDLSKPFRLAVYQRLNGNVGIPGFDEKRLVSSTASAFFLYSTQQQTPKDETDCTWISRCSIDIEIYQKTGSEVTKDNIDDYANIICGLLLTAPGVTPITSGLIQFGYAQMESIISRNLSVSETESIMQKVLRFTVDCVEQS